MRCTSKKRKLDMPLVFLVHAKVRCLCVTDDAWRWIVNCLDRPMTALLDLPFISALFFALAGLLTGHLLWFRDRTSDNQKINGLENRYIKARGTAKIRKREVVKLQRVSDTVESQLLELRERYEELEHQNDEHQSAALRAGDELARLRGERDLADEKFAGELKRSETVVSQLQEALKLKTSAEHDLEERTSSFTQLQSSHRELEVEIENLRVRLDASEKASSNYLQTIDTLKRQVGEHGQTIVQNEQTRSRLDSEVTRLREQLELVTAQAESRQDLATKLGDRLADQEETVKRHEQTQIALETEIEQLTATLDAQAEATDQSTAHTTQTIASLRQELDELRVVNEDSQQSLKATQSDLVARCEDLDRLRSERDKLKVKTEKMSDRLSDLDEEREIACTIKAERDELANDLQSAARTLGEQRETLELREQEVDQLRVQIGGLHDQMRKTDEQNSRVTSENESMSEVIKCRDETIKNLTTQLDELAPLRAELNEVALVLGEQKTLNQQRVEQIANQKLEIERRGKEIESLTSKLEPMSKIQAELDQYRPLRGELAEAIDQHAAQRQRADELEQQLAMRAAQIAELESQVELLDDTEDALADARLKIESIAKQVTQAVGQRDSIARSKDEVEAQLKKQSDQIHSQQSQLASLDQTKQSLAQMSQELTKITSERNQLTKSHAELQANISALRTEIQNQTNATEAANQHLAAKSKQYDQSIRDATELKKSIEDQRASATKLAGQLQAAEQLRPANLALQKRIDDLMTHLKRVSSEHEDSLDANTKALDRIRDLEFNLHDHATKIRDLRRERASIAGLDGRDQDQSIRRAA